MRTFLRAYWKAIVAIAVLVLLAMVSVVPGAAAPELPLAARLRAHVSALASSERNAATPAESERAARYIESVLKTEGYAIRRQEYRAGGQMVRNIEASVAKLAPGTKPARIFIVGASCDPAQTAPGASDSGTAAVLELSRLLKDMRPSEGTEVKFVFFIDEEAPWFEGEETGGPRRGGNVPVPEAAGWYTLRRHPRQSPPGMRQQFPDTGSFIAFVGTLDSSRRVQDALSAFRAVSDFPAHGLAAPAYVQGMTLSDHSSSGRFGHPAILIADTGFMRYPYYRMKEDGTPEGKQETKQDTKQDNKQDKPDYEDTARVLEGLARTIRALAGGAQG